MKNTLKLVAFRPVRIEKVLLAVWNLQRVSGDTSTTNSAWLLCERYLNLFCASHEYSKTHIAVARAAKTKGYFEFLHLTPKQAVGREMSTKIGALKQLCDLATDFSGGGYEDIIAAVEVAIEVLIEVPIDMRIRPASLALLIFGMGADSSLTLSENMTNVLNVLENSDVLKAEALEV